MTDTLNLPPKVRLGLYLFTAIGSAFAAYLFTKGYIGDAETALWAGLVAIVNTLSAANVPSLRDVEDPAALDDHLQADLSG